VDPDSSRLRIAVTDGRGRALRAPGLRPWLASVAPARARGTLAIALVTDAEVRALNRRYRGKNEPTDVLSFPADEGSTAPDTGLRAPGLRPRAPGSRRLASGSALRSLGDVVIATGVARRQAADAGHTYATEIKVLALHGLLHLLGYDHHAPTDNGRMERLEARLLRRGRLAAGLIERAHASRPAVRARRSH
jgi:probable rRNA maturation factor